MSIYDRDYYREKENTAKSGSNKYWLVFVLVAIAVIIMLALIY